MKPCFGNLNIDKDKVKTQFEFLSERARKLFGVRIDLLVAGAFAALIPVNGVKGLKQVCSGAFAGFNIYNSTELSLMDFIVGTRPE